MDNSKKYGLFAGGVDYISYGGAMDFKSFGSSVEELQALFHERREEKEYNCWGEIVDMETMTAICRNDRLWNDVTKQYEKLWKDVEE